TPKHLFMFPKQYKNIDHNHDGTADEQRHQEQEYDGQDGREHDQNSAVVNGTAEEDERLIAKQIED
ncbi:hypothetical protein TorRG33x02_270120, partial [Trema orientale]